MSQKGLRIARRIGLVNSMSIVGRMNPVGFLDSMRVAAARLNHHTQLLPTECRSILVHHSITGGDVGSKACVCTRQSS